MVVCVLHRDQGDYGSNITQNRSWTYYGNQVGASRLRRIAMVDSIDPVPFPLSYSGSEICYTHCLWVSGGAVLGSDILFPEDCFEPHGHPRSQPRILEEIA